MRITNRFSLHEGIFMKIIRITAILLLAVASSPVVAAEENSSFWIDLHPIPDHLLGDTFNIIATTNLPEGTEILYQVFDGKRCLKSGCNDPFFRGATGNIFVTRGESAKNKTIFSIDTSTLAPNEYLIAEAAIHENATGSAKFNVIETSDNHYWIVLDPIGEKYPEGVLNITGKTNLAVGDDVAIRIFNADTRGLHSQGRVKVIAGEDSVNMIHDMGNLSDFTPANYTIYAIGGTKYVKNNSPFHVSPIPESGQKTKVSPSFGFFSILIGLSIITLAVRK